MSTLICKHCYATLEGIERNQSIATCKYCNITQTLPRLCNDGVVNLYERASHFRKNNDFDKAMTLYEQILNEDTTDSEAYWSLILCTYGVEYVKDPSSGKHIPTIHRTQYTSIYSDENYKSAIKYADENQRKIYEAEAHSINEIQKGILAISANEEPFDVFICYKETDENGKRTRDSIIATELYNELTRDGLKVFFARITLEDKLGQAYEPYIFAALNSAKAMVVIGTKPEYFNAVWVKNEWSRYLTLIGNGARKMLIPAYRDMDPYDLPMEFSHLQALDMSKLGFMQDLTRGIEKIVNHEDSKSSSKKSDESGSELNSNSFLKRAFEFIEEGDFESGDEYCEKALDKDFKCAEAYLGKLMIDLKVKKRRQLSCVEHSFAENINYKRIIRLGNDELIEEVKWYLSETEKHEKDHNENARLAKEKAESDRQKRAAEQELKKLESEIIQSDIKALGKSIGAQVHDLQNNIGKSVGIQLSDVKEKLSKSINEQLPDIKKSINKTVSSVKKYIESTDTSSNTTTNSDVKYCNKWVALALCVFYLGFFGVHRFYEGDKKWGLIYLCTGGLFGLGVAYDAIRLLFMTPTRYPKKVNNR